MRRKTLVLIVQAGILLPAGLLFLLSSCTNLPPGESGLPEQAGRQPVLYPDYADVTVPPNIAPLNFIVKEKGSAFVAVMEGRSGEAFSVRSRKGLIRIRQRKWKAFMEDQKGASFSVSVFSEEGGKWTAFDPFRIWVAGEEIDPWLAYRKIPPGYETWSAMGLYQRDLTSFREKALIENQNVEENCMNCHSFNKGNPEEMLFHVRGSLGGTVLRKGESIRKVNLKREGKLSAGVYPAWHPSGEYIAFSTNRIEQYFHAAAGLDIEVLDRQSNLILYQVGDDRVIQVPCTSGDDHMETYPCWSPDGNWLYFSRADANESTPFDSIRYDIFRLAFDHASGNFAEDPEPVLMASDSGRSASFPRVSPDGHYLLCTLHPYGTFPIWHPGADLCLVDLEKGTWELPERINSENTESFHSWSSNSRWIVFSSRREDGRYTRAFITYLDNTGEFTKPFLLPRRDPRAYASMINSFNRPELITGPVQLPARKWIRAVRNHRN